MFGASGKTAGPDFGVLLLNFGGPETLDDVRPFLFNLFSDPEIIRIRNNRLRGAIAWWIATARQGKSRGLYRQIGGGSPLRKITEAQAAALGVSLASRGCAARTYVGMRCWKPTIEDAVRHILADGIRKLAVLPLFPQFSVTTSGSCIRYFRGIARQQRLMEQMEVQFVDAWFDEPLYLEAMSDLIHEAQERFSTANRANVHLLYSAHSIPACYVKEGDPYLRQTEATVALIQERLDGSFPFTLAFQSKVGPIRWLEPSTEKAIADLGRRGIANVLVVPVSFVSDHIETLQEIDIRYRRLALKTGIRAFERAASLNLHPKFIEALANITLQAAAKG